MPPPVSQNLGSPPIRARRPPVRRNRLRGLARRPPTAPPRQTGGRVTRGAGTLLGRALRRAEDQPGAARLIGATVAAVLGGLLLVVGATADNYLHRGIETGTEQPYVRHPVGRELATNVNLWEVPDDELGPRAARIRDDGFRFVRQPFPWAEIEPERGRFDWDRADAVVAAFEDAGLLPVAVLAESPSWARAPETAEATDAPPAETADYERYVGAFAARYGGRVGTMQLWDRPNEAARWGGTRSSAAAYAELVALASNTARSAAPGVRLVLAELAPVPTDGPTDVAFLDGVYRSGAGPFIDVVAVVVDGGDRSPYDRRVDEGRINLSRAILVRELLLDHDAGATPIWATHFGWARRPPVGVGASQQAAFTVAGLDRARDEWPWLGLAFAWSHGPAGADDPEAAYALVDGSVGTPLLEALRGLAAEGGAATAGFLATGAAEGERPGALAYDGAWTDQAPSPGYRTTTELGASITVRFDGSGLVGLLRYSPSAGPVRATLDGEPLPGGFGRTEDGAASVVDLWSARAANVPITLVSGLNEGPHELRLSLEGGGEFTLGGLVVVREVPTLWPVVVLAALGGLLLFVAVREVAYLLARRAGYLPRRREVDLGAPLTGWHSPHSA